MVIGIVFIGDEYRIGEAATTGCHMVDRTLEGIELDKR